MTDENENMFNYISNLGNALIGKPNVETKVITIKDPNGLMKRDIALLEKYAGTGKYKVGDSLESVAWREGQLATINFIKTKLIHGDRDIL